ncbi:hypothetical protein B8W69_16150 [Mycobacterium vulneris]|uniref:Uncharacterized protein n=2 Tax=Mycolicibacterium vulneris TaxID=547163 RepID=A0A1X2KYF0_9MYCO|nr:hypothetical protein B8W69_16150 [Mycolicibacterium vulneris]
MPVVRFYQRADGRPAIWVVHNGEYTFYVDCARCGKPLPPQVRRENPYRRRMGLGDQQRWKDLHPECRVSDDEAYFRDMKAKKARRKREADHRRKHGGISDYRMAKYYADEAELDALV